MGAPGHGEHVSEARLTERVLMPGDFYQSPPHSYPHLPTNLFQPHIPFSTQERSAQQTCFAHLAVKSSTKALITATTADNFYVCLVLLIFTKIAAQREFDFLSLLLKSRSATFTHSESFFCPIALVADNIKLSENRRCQKIP